MPCGIATVASGPGSGFLSGIGNSASGSPEVNGRGSGFFNFGLPTPASPDPLDGVFSGFNSGLLNFGANLSGIFSLGRLLG